MNPVKDNSKIGGLVQKRLEVFDRLLFGQIQPEFLLDLLVYISMLDIRDIRVHHERHQAENKVRALAEDGKGGETQVFEPRVMRRRGAAHGIHHFLADLNRRWERLRVTAEDVTKVH